MTTILGRKFDDAKPRWALFPWGSLEHIAKVLTYGAEKYEPNNWQFVPEAEERYFSAGMRHLVAWKQGERLDPESGLPHLAHAACCFLFLLWFDDDAKLARSDIPTDKPMEFTQTRVQPWKPLHQKNPA